MNKMSTAIIGTGKAATMHAKALKNINECEFVAVHSRSIEKARAFASINNINPYSDITSMIGKERIDIVIICTPHPAHKSGAITAFESGSHVLIEKPLASSLEDCDAMIHAAKKNKKKLGVVSQRRFLEPSQRMKKAIDSGKIGKPVLGMVMLLGWRDELYYNSDAWRGNWKEEGGGVLVNQAPHQIDLLQWFMGDEIDEVYGVWRNFNHPSIEVDDTAVAIINFKNGSIGNIVVSNSQKPGLFGKVHIHGSNGASLGVQTDGGAMFIAGVSNVLEPPKNDIWTINGEEHFLAEWQKEDIAFFNTIDPIEYYIRLQDRDFISSVIEDREPMVTARDGRKTVEIFTAIYRSMKTKQPVKWPVKITKPPLKDNM